MASGRLARAPVPRPTDMVARGKPRLGSRDDVHEREADRVARTLLSESWPARLSTDVPSADDERGSSTAGSQAAVGPHVAQLGAGAPLNPATRAFFEPRFARDFSRVRVHTNDEAARSAQSMNAAAYTVGDQIVFNRGRYGVGSARDRGLLAHELTHVVQQSGGGAMGITPAPWGPAQRQDDGGAPPGGTRQQEPAERPTEPEEQIAESTEIRTPAPDRVRRIIMSRTEMFLWIETGTRLIRYTMQECTIPVGSYETRVTIDGNDFELHFGSTVIQDEERFDFDYRVERGQEYPSLLLRNQDHVHVDVINGPVRSQRPEAPEQEQPRQPECVFRFDDRVLVEPATTQRRLFNPISREIELWSHTVPLGEFGWLDLTASAAASLRGAFSASYGPGRLTDICLTHLVDRQTRTSELPPIYRRDTTNDIIGGRARFSLPARAVVRLIGEGWLRIAGEYLSVFDIASLEGRLDAVGEARVDFNLDAAVEILARGLRTSTTVRNPPPIPPLPPSLPLEVTVNESSIRDINLAAEVALRGRAGLTFKLKAGAELKVAGFDLWSQTWDLARFNPGVSWKGGLKYSPNPGIHWDFGDFGVGEEAELPEDETSTAGVFHEDGAEMDEDTVGQILSAVLDEGGAHEDEADGLEEDDPIPFTWRKPIEFYPPEIEVPNAREPHAIQRDDGPTSVYFGEGRGSTYEDIGVAPENWPHQGKTFQYIPSARRRDREKNRLRRLLDRLGYDRSGVDVDHVHELQFGGDDAFDNLWPASNDANRSAGARHDEQLDQLRQQHGNLAGRYFVISRVRI